METHVKELVQHYTVDEVAQSLKASPWVIRRKAKAGVIGSIKTGKSYLFTKEHIDSYLLSLNKGGCDE